MIGKKFGRLTVLAKLKKRNKGNGGIRYRCVCNCGNFLKVLGTRLRIGKTKSCGCFHRDRVSKDLTKLWKARKIKHFVKHGEGKNKNRTGTYLSWANMVQRCTNKKTPFFKNYGGRGITICSRWRKFENFKKDMGERPEGLTLERKDNNEGYSKSNCTWATREEQSNNTRRSLKALKP